MARTRKPRSGRALPRPRLRLLCCAVACLATPLTAAAQSLAGVVRDSTGAPVPDADVMIASSRALARTDSAGRFVLWKLGAGEMQVSVRRMGYVPRSFDVALHRDAQDTVTIILAMNAAEVPGMVISAQDMRRRLAIEDFYRRRTVGTSGHYVTREEIEARHASRLSDALRDIPGIQFVRSNMSGSVFIRFDNASVYRRDCLPQYWIDGQRVPNAQIDDFPARDIEGVEVYSGPAGTPMQFSQGALTTCGTIVIWSRVPGT